MTHGPESSFMDVVEDWLTAIYGEMGVTRQFHDPATERRHDFVVNTEWEGYVIEVENDFESTFDAAMKAAVGACSLSDVGDRAIIPDEFHGEFVPAVVVPTGHVEEPEWSYITNYVLGQELDYPVEEED